MELANSAVGAQLVQITGKSFGDYGLRLNTRTSDNTVFQGEVGRRQEKGSSRPGDVQSAEGAFF